MALHHVIQRILLIGARLNLPPAPPDPQPPAILAPLITAIAPAHREFDERALLFGNRYRSGFWAIYLLSAMAVLFAVLPLALGWDDVWAVGEVLIISIVASIYWLGHRRDWQGQWLRARTTAELTWYLPLVAPLVDFAPGPAGPGDEDVDWYARVFDPGQHLKGASDVESLCARIEPLARETVWRAWSDPGFIGDYAHWTIEVLNAQKHYHHRVWVRNVALQHRVHALNGWLFGLTAVGALLHLVLHNLWLSLVTTFFPALGASLHGALAQSESYRLGVSSERLMNDLDAAIARIRAALHLSTQLPTAGGVKDSIEAALALILQEHQDWHMLVRPHHLPLA
jgi:hypothetical protein